MTNNPGFADLDRFTIKKNSKTGNIELLFFDGNNEWQSLTNKRTGEFLAPKTLIEKFGSVNAVKNFLGVDTPPVLERSLKTATKLKVSYPLTQRWKVCLLESFHPWLRKFTLKHEKHDKIPT